MSLYILLSAKSALESKGFKVVVNEEQEHDKIKKGNVISQSPKAEEVDEGSTIVFLFFIDYNFKAFTF